MNCNQSEQICCFIITYHVLVKYLVLPTIFRIFANSPQKQNYLVDISKTPFVEEMKLNPRIVMKYANTNLTVGTNAY